MAGSARDRELWLRTRDRFVEFGLEDVEVTTHEVLLPWPEEVDVEMTSPTALARVDARGSDPGGSVHADLDRRRPGFRTTRTPRPARSPRRSSTRAAAIRPTTTRLARRGIDIRGKIALVRYSVPYSYRGFKALTAQQRGAAGDPDLFRSGRRRRRQGRGVSRKVRGVRRATSSAAASSTTSWCRATRSRPDGRRVPGARRIAKSEAVSLPAIISAPLSYKDARVILEAARGLRSCAEWSCVSTIASGKSGPSPA